MTTWHKLLIAAAVILVLAVLLAFAPHFVLWLAGVFPTPVGTSPWYQFWSGVGLALVVSANRWLLSSYRKDQCHVDPCRRLGRYPVAGGVHLVCRRHHPHEAVRDGKVTHEHVCGLHEDFLRGQGMDNPAE